jgi:hypothetical protein
MTNSERFLSGGYGSLLTCLGTQLVLFSHDAHDVSGSWISTSSTFNILKVSRYSYLREFAIVVGAPQTTTGLGGMGDATKSSADHGFTGEQSYPALKRRLLSKPGPVLPPPPSAPSQSLTHAISSLFLHPSLEAALHLLNDDLVSAHASCTTI